jgi:hypothetical protein
VHGSDVGPADSDQYRVFQFEAGIRERVIGTTLVDHNEGKRRSHGQNEWLGRSSDRSVGYLH